MTAFTKYSIIFLFLVWFGSGSFLLSFFTEPLVYFVEFSNLLPMLKLVGFFQALGVLLWAKALDIAYGFIFENPDKTCLFFDFILALVWGKLIVLILRDTPERFNIVDVVVYGTTISLYIVKHYKSLLRWKTTD